MAGLVRPLLGGLGGGAIAGVVNVAVAVAAGAAGAPIEGSFGGPGSPVTALPVFVPMISSVVPAFFAWAAWAALSKLSASPQKIFVGLAIAFGLFSLGGPLTLAGASTTTQLLLAFMHIPASIGITLGVLRGAK
jgi:hypothetical protein